MEAVRPDNIGANCLGFTTFAKRQARSDYFSEQSLGVVEGVRQQTKTDRIPIRLAQPGDCGCGSSLSAQDTNGKTRSTLRKVGRAAMFLASEDASVVHGATLIVDGGFLIY